MPESPREAPRRNAAEKKRRQPRWRRWLRRVLKAGGALLLLLILFILLLPSLITWLPVERFAANAYKKQITGNVEIEGVSLGWFSPFRIERVLLTDADGSDVFLDVREVEVSRSLLQMAFTKDRVGKISVGSVETNVRRGRDGVFNYTQFIPEPAEEAPPEEVKAEPFELDLQKLIPEFPVPTSQFHFNVANDLFQRCKCFISTL